MLSSAASGSANVPLRSAGTVLIHLLAAAVIRRQAQQFSTASATPSTSSVPLRKMQSVYIRCTSPFPQVESFVTVCVDRYNLELQVAEGNMRDALESYLDGRREAKGEEGKIEAVMVGTRRNDPHGGQSRAGERRVKRSGACSPRWTWLTPMTHLPFRFARSQAQGL